jgi:hypothetical protein
VSPPGDAHGRCAVEALCDGHAEDIITVLGAIMMDWTGWSSPSAQHARRGEKTAQGLALQGYATGQSRVTSVTHADWTLWYPLKYKRRDRPW